VVIPNTQIDINLGKLYIQKCVIIQSTQDKEKSILNHQRVEGGLKRIYLVE
jgi:hypothetical protein